MHSRLFFLNDRTCVFAYMIGPQVYNCAKESTGFIPLASARKRVGLHSFIKLGHWSARRNDLRYLSANGTNRSRRFPLWPKAHNQYYVNIETDSIV